MNNSLIRKPFSYSFFYASIILIAVNFVVFFATSIFPDLQYILGLCPPLFLGKNMYWQLFTYMFVHGSWSHILSNMIGLLIFGFMLERTIGSKEFLLLYLLCGFVSGICSLLFFLATGMVNSLLVGASGALFSVMFAYAVVFPKAKIYIWGILPVPSPLLVIGYAAIELFSQLYGIKSNVAHYTHLFGFLAAYIYFIVRLGINPIQVWKNAYFY